MPMRSLRLPHRARPIRGGRRQDRGFTMIEVLIAVVVVLFGLLGLAGVQVRALQAEFESYQRKQAFLLLQDMVDRIQANRVVASCYALTTAGTGSPYAGTGATLPSCTAGSTAVQAVANDDLAKWSATLQGAAVAATSAASAPSIGAMIGARGCITADGGGVYTVSVAWQGMSATAAPPAALKCGTGQYGADDALRRVVSATIQVATLN
ncbi:MAG: type IV pilus modification protein PilV [Caldimonas sp.]